MQRDTGNHRIYHIFGNTTRFKVRSFLDINQTLFQFINHKIIYIDTRSTSQCTRFVYSQYLIY